MATDQVPLAPEADRPRVTIRCACGETRSAGDLRRSGEAISAWAYRHHELGHRVVAEVELDPQTIGFVGGMAAALLPETDEVDGGADDAD